MKGLRLPRKIPYPLLFCLSLFCLDFLMWLVPGEDYVYCYLFYFARQGLLKVPLAPSRNFAYCIHCFFLCPFFLNPSPLFTTADSQSKQTISSDVQDLSNQQNEPSSPVPMRPSLALPCALPTCAVEGQVTFARGSPLLCRTKGETEEECVCNCSYCAFLAIYTPMSERVDFYFSPQDLEKSLSMLNV